MNKTQIQALQSTYIQLIQMEEYILQTKPQTYLEWRKQVEFLQNLFSEMGLSYPPI
ncbi:MAG: hypothetical protein QW683_08770 [Candidatus Caldarchaeum sp.]